VSEPRLRQHFSMIRGFHLADLFTIGNGFCGVAAIFEAMRFLAGREAWHIYAAAVLVPLARVFDVLDGRVARWRHASSPMGRELDSLADVISFVVAPAAIAFAAGLDSVLDQFALMYFVACGVSRLARYNITADAMAADAGKVTYFEGTPIPTSVVPLACLMLAFHYDLMSPVRLLGVDVHPLSALFFLSGCLMISKTFRVPKP
jgi:CDP-diacylglycerol--serine O-phosphatidyltransferase